MHDGLAGPGRLDRSRRNAGAGAGPWHYALRSPVLGVFKNIVTTSPAPRICVAAI